MHQHSFAAHASAKWVQACINTRVLLTAQDVVKALLDAGADSTAHDNFGTSAIFEACSAGHDAIIEILLQRGAK